MKIEFEVEDLISESEIRETAIEELKYALRRKFEDERGICRIIGNLSYEFIKNLIHEELGGDENFESLLRKKIRESVEKGVQFYVFRRADAWERSESPAVKILDEECQNARPLIRECVENHIRNYPFYELERDMIGDAIYDVIMDKILAPPQREEKE